MIGNTNSSSKSGVTIKKLWENASPGSAFGYQSVPFVDDGYDMFVIDFKCTSSASKYDSLIITSRGKAYMLVTSDNSGKAVERTVTVKTDSTTITIENGYIYKTYGSYVQDNTYAIPISIYGIKGVAK